ncbi:MAG: DegV family protein [Anaerolineales bacterium]
MLRIVTDGSADIPLEWQKEFDIQVVPANILFGDKTYIQGVDLDNEGFYRLVDETHKIPKTAQPTPHQFAEFYKKLVNPGDSILSINVTGKLSGTFNSARIAAEELADQIKITVFDSLSGSAGIALLCREARLLERAGKSTEEIVKRLEYLRSKTGIVLTLDTLEYARLSGRVGALQAALTSVLNVKPIAIVTDGVVNITERVRTRRASMERVLEIVKEKVGDQAVNMAVIHARDPQAGALLLERAREMFNIQNIILTDLSISVAANLGPGTVGIAFCPVE